MLNRSKNQQGSSEISLCREILLQIQHNEPGKEAEKIKCFIF